ncbi:MAG TPA: glutamate-1-semialdehyde 2,1-aminomutase [Vicinamibacterales bacterium]|nr:glutamate-1-semialdehyde 2,1-aminomutase [Vicinamibacterales bacterium]
MTSSNDVWHRRALATAPGGVHSPVRAFRSVGGVPVFVARATGAQLIDVDGREYIDFCMSFGPLILGHGDADVAAAARAALDDGWSYGASEPYSVRLAEWMLARLPFLERVRFVSSGTEAVMSALRVARAATGRAAVLKFDGCYHGHADAMLVKAGSGLAGQADASSAGISPAVVADTLVAPLDDDAALDAVFAAHGSRLAAAIIEPLPANYGLLPQRQAFLERLADHCRRAGALLIFDEVISGFRVGLTGMAGSTGIMPDLACYGKVIGGGFPLAAYAGRRELMDRVAPAGDVYQAGTLSANPVAVRAGLATLEKMERIDGWRVLEDRADRFCGDLASAIAAVPGRPDIVRRGSIFWLTCRDGVDADWFARFFHHALAGGVYLPPSGYEVCFLSMAHDARTLETAGAVLAAAADAAAQP